jgi:threonine/homoserine/homoserine lactone efflux protein
MHADNLVALLGIAAALIAGAMSPGPSFLMIARTAVASSRADGLAAALGMGAGAVVFAVAALAGLQALFAAVPLLYVMLKVAGGAYLVFLAWRIWRGARSPLQAAEPGLPVAERRLARSFLLGLATQVSNPKTAIVMAGIFAALLPREIDTWFFVVLPLIVFVIDAVWYAIVVFALSASASRSAYLRFKTALDRIAGGVMALLGFRLIAGSTE